MDDHGQHDQRQTPYPVCAPIHGIVEKEGCENGLVKVHQDILELDASQRKLKGATNSRRRHVQILAKLPVPLNFSCRSLLSRGQRESNLA